MKKIVSIIAFAALFAGCQNKVEQISLTDDAVLKLSSETIDGKIILLEPKTRTIDIRVEAEKISDEPLLVDIAARSHFFSVPTIKFSFIHSKTVVMLCYRHNIFHTCFFEK